MSFFLYDRLGECLDNDCDDRLGECLDNDETLRVFTPTSYIDELIRRNSFMIQRRKTISCLRSRSVQNMKLNHKNTLRVLLVDDMVINNKIMDKLLRKQSMDFNYNNLPISVETTMVEDGLHALNHFFTHKTDFYHLIVMDAQMPVMNGFIATKMLRKYGYKGYIVGSTGLQTNEYDYFISCGADVVIEKPILPSVVHNILSNVL